MIVALIVTGTVAMAAIAAIVALGLVLTQARADADARWVAFVSTLEHAHTAAQAEWVNERRELVNRVQAPQFVPRSPVTEFKIPELEEDGIEEVGTIQQLDEEQLNEYLQELS